MRYYLSYKRLWGLFAFNDPIKWSDESKFLLCISSSFADNLQACESTLLFFFFFCESLHFWDLAVLGVGLNMISDDISLIQSNILENVMQYIK